MIIYLLFVPAVLVFLLISIQNKEHRLVAYPFALISYVVIIIFSGFRYGIGTDYFNYEEVFFGIDYNNEYNANMEWGFYYLAKMLPRTKSGFYALIFITSLLTNYIFYLAIKEQVKVNGSRAVIIIFFFITGLFFLPFNGVRQGISIAVILYSYAFIKKRRLFLFLLLIFIAFLFHKSAVLFTPLYFLYGFSRLKICGILLVALSVLVVKLGAFNYLVGGFLSILGDKYSRYIHSPPDFGGTGLGVYLYLFVFLVVFSSGFIIKTNSKNKVEYSFLFFLFSVGISLRFIALENIIFVRLSYYFTAYDIFFIPFFIKLFDKRLDKYLISFVVISCYLITFVASIAKSNGLLPYKNIIIESVLK